jgi:DNA-binding PadR family transcriptional regulator
MGERQLLGEVEQLVLLAILRIGEGAYGVPIRDEILNATGVELTRGTIYVTLDRLERKGYLRSWYADPTPEPGGKSRKCVAIERDGVMALRAARRMVDRLSAGTALAPRKGR